MTTRYPHDDDWGDWMHEVRKQKALDKRWEQEFERSMRETDADRWADALDRAMGRTYSDDAVTCQRCGRKGRAPCPCGDADRPTEHPDTGFKI